MKSPNIRLLTIVALGMLCILNLNACKNRKPLNKQQSMKNEYNFNGLLFKSVFYNFHKEYNPIELRKGDNFIALPPNIKKRINKYIQRFNSINKNSKNEGLDWYDQINLEKKDSMKLAIISLIESDSIETLADEYVQNAILGYEWEGMSDGPLSEAEYAERFIKNHPETPLLPYLHIFLIHRYRSVFECLGLERNESAKKEIAEKYHLNLQNAKKHKDIIFALIAEDIDKQDYIYLHNQGRP